MSPKTNGGEELVRSKETALWPHNFSRASARLLTTVNQLIVVAAELATPTEEVSAEPPEAHLLPRGEM